MEPLVKHLSIGLTRETSASKPLLIAIRPGEQTTLAKSLVMDRHPKGNNVRLDALADGLFYRIESWREAVRDKFNATLGSAPYTGVLTALAIGDQGSIPMAQWQIFTRTGVVHLMSISGLHITMLASAGFVLT